MGRSVSCMSRMPTLPGREKGDRGGRPHTRIGTHVEGAEDIVADRRSRGRARTRRRRAAGDSTSQARRCRLRQRKQSKSIAAARYRVTWPIFRRSSLVTAIPMNAHLVEHLYRGVAADRAETTRPPAILAISAHWYVTGTADDQRPRRGRSTTSAAFRDGCTRCISGARQYGARTARPAMLAPLPVALDESGASTTARGRCCGTCTRAPTCRSSSSDRRDAAAGSSTSTIGRRLAPLRGEGVLIVGSGNLVHNLHAYAWGRHVPEPCDWAVRFEAEARARLAGGENHALVDYEALGRDARLSIPTPDHYLPLFYVIGTARRRDVEDVPGRGRGRRLDLDAGGADRGLPPDHPAVCAAFRPRALIGFSVRQKGRTGGV